MREKFIPFYLQDIAEAYSEGGLNLAIGVGVPAFFGIGVQTYTPRIAPSGAFKTRGGTTGGRTTPSLKTR